MAKALQLQLIAGTPKYRIWCDRCMTSAGMRVSIFVLGGMGVDLVGVVEKCGQCDSVEVPEAELEQQPPDETGAAA